MKMGNMRERSSEILFVRVRPMVIGENAGSFAHCPELLPSAVRSEGITLPSGGYAPQWATGAPTATKRISSTTQPKATPSTVLDRGDVAAKAGSVPRGRPV